jgi:hypothetical protein
MSGERASGPLPMRLVGLTIVIGLVNPFSYLSLGHVFVGFGLAGQEASQSCRVWSQSPPSRSEPPPEAGGLTTNPALGITPIRRCGGSDRTRRGGRCRGRARRRQRLGSTSRSDRSARSIAR